MQSNKCRLSEQFFVPKAPPVTTNCLQRQALGKGTQHTMTEDSQHGFRIFILGAGFSVPAGLPLASDLYKLVKTKIEDAHGTDTKFHSSLQEYIDYRKECDNVELSEDDVNLEEFMSYLDVEHFLGLQGSDTLTEEGNGAQLLIKQFIGKVIHEKTPSGDELPQQYYDFVNGLTVNDIVISLNYDLILESALEHVGLPYRLFSYRYSSIGSTSNTVDNSKKELVVLKLHGSLDWFSNKSYLSGLKVFKAQGLEGGPNDPIFNNRNGDLYQPYPLIDGPRSKDDPLLFIHRIKNVDEFYAQTMPPGLSVPMILSPSHMKIVYATPFMEFWNGLGQAGSYNLGVSIIGFSLPEHDDYIKISLYKMIGNYQRSWWDELLLDTLKDNVKVIDYKESDTEIEEFKLRYSFIAEAKAEYYFDGFNSNSVTMLYDNKRVT